MKRVIVVEDDPAIARLIDALLRREGYQCAVAPDAQCAGAEMANGPADAMLVDLGLPDRDGLDLIRSVRATSAIAIIAVTARLAIADKIAALDFGADDYVTKPFDGNELLARLRSALRRADGHHLPADVPLTFGPLEMDVGRHIVRCRGEIVSLSRKEFSLLRELIEAAGRLVSHRALLERVWGKAHRADIDYLRVAVRALRLKLERDPGQPRLIRNEPGLGYRLVDEDDGEIER